MSEMVERVAAAILAEQETNRSAFPSNLDLARAAIEAMRVPTQAMIDACDLNIPTEGTITGVWADMIDAALK